MKGCLKTLFVPCAIIGALVLLLIFRAIFFPIRSTTELSSSSESSTSEPSVPPAGLPTNWRDTILTPNATSFDWGTWKIAIRNLTFTDHVPEMFGRQTTAGSDSIFVYFSFTVTNESHEGDDFIPQNNLKLMTGGNKYDAADIERDGGDYLRNIEPTLTRDRECYFELPRNQVGNSFKIRFERIFGETRDLLVSLSTASPTPSPTPLAQSTPTPSPTPLAQSTSKPTPETVVMRAEPVATPTAEPYAFIAKMQTAFDNHDWRTITDSTADGKLNYFGHRHASNAYIIRDMQNDALIYSSAKSTYYPETFTHDLSDPSMIYMVFIRGDTVVILQVCLFDSQRRIDVVNALGQSIKNRLVSAPIL